MQTQIRLLMEQPDLGLYQLRKCCDDIAKLEFVIHTENGKSMPVICKFSYLLKISFISHIAIELHYATCLTPCWSGVFSLCYT